MDLWGQLIGKKEQNLVVVEGEEWVGLTASRALDRSMDRRAAKEGWEDSGEGHEFHVLLTRTDARDRTTAGIQLEVLVNGVVTDRLGSDTVGRAIEQMRVNDAYAAAARAVATRSASPDGTRWTLRVEL